MIGDACVFVLTQISNDFDCEYGDLATRRAGQTSRVVHRNSNNSVSVFMIN